MYLEKWWFAIVMLVYQAGVLLSRNAAHGWCSARWFLVFVKAQKFAGGWLTWTSRCQPWWNLVSAYPLVNVYTTMEHHNFQWVNQRSKWPFSIAKCLFTRGYFQRPIDFECRWIMVLQWNMFCPEYVAKGSRFTLGGLGVETCLRDPASGVHNCPQPFAHGNCGRKVALSMGKAKRTCLFPRVRRCGHVVPCGRRGTLWHSTCVRRNVCARPSWQKSCRVYGESQKNVSFSTCQKMWSCRSWWQAWHFVTFDVCEEECVCATVVAEKLPCLWGKPQKRIFFHVSEDVVMSFLVAGVALCDIRRVWGGMCVRDGRGRKVAVSMGEATKTCLFPRVRRCGHVVPCGRRGTLWHSTCVRRNVCARPSWQKSCPVYGESQKNVSFSTCQKMWSCRSLWQAWHFVTFDVCEEECVCATVVAEKLPCLWGKPQKRVFFHVSEDVVMSFLVAGVALCDIRRVWGGMCVRDGRGRKVAVSMGEATKTCLFPRVRRCGHVVPCGRRGTLWHSTCVRRNVCARPSWQKSCRVYGGSHRNVSFSTCQKMWSSRFALQSWHFVTFDVFQPECVCANRREGKSAVSLGKATKTCLSLPVRRCAHVFLRGRRGTQCHLTSPLHTVHSTFYTPHATLQILHSTLHTSHSTLHNSTLHTPHFTLHTLHSTLHSLHSTHYTPDSTLHTPHFTLHTLHSTLYTPTLHSHHTPHFANHTLHSPPHTPHFTLHTPHLHLILLAFTSVSFAWSAVGFVGFSCFTSTQALSREMQPSVAMISRLTFGTQVETTNPYKR